MALDLSKYNIFKGLSARSRIVVLVGVVIGLIFLVYLGTRYFTGGERTVGPSRVAGAPTGLQSTPGGQITAEYYRAVEQANIQREEKARITGQSAMPTLIRPEQQVGKADCTIICAEQEPNVKTLLDDWVRKGLIPPDVASELQKLADQNVSPEDYAAYLDRLVKEGKLTPEQARQLLEQYRRQHAAKLLKESAAAMDGLIKSGQLPLDVANELLDAQKRKLSPAEYAAMLQDMVRQGKITPEMAQRLLAQYTQQRAREITMQSIAALRQMGSTGELVPDVLNQLIDFENQMVPLDTLDSSLKQFVASGKMTPAVANKVLDEYRRQKALIGATGTIDQLVRQAEEAAYKEIADLLSQGKITQDVADTLRDMIQRNVPLDQFIATVNQLVSQRKLTPAIAKLKIADYTLVKKLRDQQQRLANLQANNASPEEFANELKRAVQAGLLTPEQAAQMMKEYQAGREKFAAVAPTGATSDFAALQQRVAAQAPAGQVLPTAAEFAVPTAPVVVSQISDQERVARIQNLINAMSTQAGQLVASWQPYVMLHREGIAQVKASEKTRTTTTTTVSRGEVKGTSTTESSMAGAPLIKAGTILFGVLDTAVNSDYPDTPVLVTIVSGKFKGAKLLGKLNTAKGPAGQLDRVSLNFTLLNMEQWPKSKTVTAYAIDPDTARTVMASSVNYHYLLRFGAIFATSFLQGYANAILASGSTSTTGVFGTSTVTGQISPANKIMVALGQIGQTLGNVTQNYVNIPPTVRVDSGVSLGILFMADVT